MPDSLTLLPPITQAITVALFYYTTYWAFAIRRVLASPLFRQQALRVGLVGPYFAVAFSFGALLGLYTAGSTALINFVGSFLFFLGFIMIFAWADATVRVARKSDPLLRDTLHWRRLRGLIWAALIIVLIAEFGLALPLVFVNQSPSGTELLPAFITIVAVMLSAAPALFLSGARSKDPTLRRHLRWFGLFVVFFFAATSAGFGFYLFHVSIAPLVGELIGYVPYIAAAYSLYRSTKSLVPISHLPPLGT